MPGTVYIAGPMRGYPRFNFDAFDNAAKRLRADGYTVFNPAEHDRETLGIDPDRFPNGQFHDAGYDYAMTDAFLRKALAWDLARICESTHIALLPGWERSEGVALEHHLANTLRLKTIHLAA